MLYQENSEAFVRHHSEQFACGNMRGTDNGRSNFLPEKCQIAVCQRGEKVSPFDEELVHGVHLANAALNPSLMETGVREAPVMDHDKRPASDDMPDIVEYKRLKQEDQIISNDTAYADEYVREYPTYMTCERSFESPAYEIEESEDEGVDSPIHFSLAHTYVEDDLWPASFHQSVGLCPTRKPVLIGPNHQAELPECRPFGTKSSSVGDKAAVSASSHISDGSIEEESDKWIRNCVMPMPDTDALSSMLEPVYSKVGCDCVDEDSINCVRKHVSEARKTLKVSLGADTFRELGFYNMGEEVASRWTEEEEHLFQEVVSANPASLRRNFWDELPLAFPSKSSKELVSYYFNVFILRKRAVQNRFDPMNMDSDDDEWQVGGDDEFAIRERADEYLPTESLTDQDDGACNQVPTEENFYEDSDEEDELDNGSGDKHDGVQGNGMLSEGLPVMLFMDHNQESFKLDADAQDDSCTSFEAHQIGVEDGTHTDIAEDHHYRNDGFGGVAEHGFFGDHCDTKVWEIGFTSGWEKDEFFSTNNVIEEVFGKGSCEDGNDAAGGQDII